jgi:hypothetical protein
MELTAKQHLQIAAAYEKAAADETLPCQLRTAFANKAKWYRMLSQIQAAKASMSAHGRIPGIVSEVIEAAPKMRYLSLAERLSRARVARGIL